MKYLNWIGIDGYMLLLIVIVIMGLILFVCGIVVMGFGYVIFWVVMLLFFVYGVKLDLVVVKVGMLNLCL